MSNAISAEKVQKMRNILKRKRLNVFLKETLKVPLTVVTAPAGYGKTTAVKGFLAGRREKVTWMQFTHANNDTNYFWDKFSNLFAGINKNAAQKLHTIGFPSDISCIDNVFKIIRGSYNPTIKHIIVFDDYHLVSRHEIDTFMETLVREKINNLHIVIITRHDPGFDLIGLNLKGLVNIISQNELEFIAEEIQEYAKLCECKISFEMAQKMQKITEGWVSAIYLFILQYRQSGKIGDTININTLMEKTVYQKFDTQSQYLLALLSIPDSFTKAQIEYATETPRVLKSIDLFYETNAFIKYDTDNSVYRMHSLFRQFLKQKLKEFPDTDTKRFYVRIGQWYINNNKFMTGFRYIFEAGEYEILLNAVKMHGSHGITQTHKNLLMDCFDSIPKDTLYKYPIANFVYIIRLITFNEEKKAIHLLEQYKLYTENSKRIENDKRRKILGEIALIRSIVNFNDIYKMVEYHKKAYELLDEGTSIGDENNPFTFGSPSLLYLYYKNKGDLKNLVNYFKKNIKYYRNITHGCGTGGEYAITAEHLFECGKPAEAELTAKKAIYTAKTKNQIGIIIVAGFVLIRICMYNGNLKKALGVFDELYKMAENCPQHMYLTTLDICKGSIYCLINDYRKIPEWIRKGDMGKNNLFSQCEGTGYIIYAKSLILIKDYIQLELLCGTMKRIYDKYTYQIGYIYTYIFDSVSKYKLYGVEQAKPSLLSALEIAKSDGIVMVFVENCEHIVDILLSIKQDGCFDNIFIDRILDYYCLFEKNIKKVRREYNTRIKNPVLTNREKEILYLITQKKTNKQIAKDLFVTEATIKKAASNIYRKLNVKGRKEAVTAAKNINFS